MAAVRSVLSLPCVSDRQQDGLNSQWVGKRTHQVHASGVNVLSGEYRFLDLPTIDSADEGASPGVRTDFGHLDDPGIQLLAVDLTEKVLEKLTGELEEFACG